MMERRLVHHDEPLTSINTGSGWHLATREEIDRLKELTLACRKCGMMHHPAAKGNRCVCREIL